MSHSSMLKARRQHQKTRKLIENEEKKAKRLAREALKGPKKEKVKKERVKKQKDPVAQTDKVAKKPKISKEELSRQGTAKPKAPAAGGKKTGAK